MEIKISVSIGELIDKITILEIKSKKLKDKNKLENVNLELSVLNSVLVSNSWMRVKLINLNPN